MRAQMASSRSRMVTSRMGTNKTDTPRTMVTASRDRFLKDVKFEGLLFPTISQSESLRLRKLIPLLEILALKA